MATWLNTPAWYRKPDMKRVLIIEDDQIVATACRNRLGLEGFQVEVSHDGQNALDALRRFEPEALLLDLMLPGMSGVEVLRRVRSEPGFQQVPVIVFSNTWQSNLVEDAWQAGATRCLCKSRCPATELVAVLKDALETGDKQPAGAGSGRLGNQG
jgi:CheY-like chemotaxis protein